MARWYHRCPTCGKSADAEVLEAAASTEAMTAHQAYAKHGRGRGLGTYREYRSLTPEEIEWLDDIVVDRANAWRRSIGLPELIDPLDDEESG